MQREEAEVEGLSIEDLNAVLDDLSGTGHETDCADTCARCGPLLQEARDLLKLLDGVGLPS